MSKVVESMSGVDVLLSRKVGLPAPDSFVYHQLIAQMNGRFEHFVAWKTHDHTTLPTRLLRKCERWLLKTVEGWSRWHRSSISLCTLEMESHDGQHSSEVRYWCDTVLEPYPTVAQGHPNVLFCSEACQLQ